MSGAGDINNDGFDDLVIGSPEGAGSPYSGETYLVFGSQNVAPSGALDISDLDGSDGFNLEGAAGDMSGHSVAGAGDVNNDGYDDLIVGSPGTDLGSETDAGTSYLIYGNDFLIS